MKIYGNSIIKKTKVISIGDHGDGGFVVHNNENHSLVDKVCVNESGGKVRYHLGVGKAGQTYCVGFEIDMLGALGIASCDNVQSDRCLAHIEAVPNFRYNVSVTPKFDSCIDLQFGAPNRTLKNITFSDHKIDYVKADNIVVDLKSLYPMRGMSNVRDYIEIGDEKITYVQCVDIVDNALVKLETPIVTEITDEDIITQLRKISNADNIESMNCVPIVKIER